MVGVIADSIEQSAIRCRIISLCIEAARKGSASKRVADFMDLIVCSDIIETDLFEVVRTPGYGRKGGIDACDAGGDEEGVAVYTSPRHRADSTSDMKRTICSLVVDASVAGIGLEGEGSTTDEFCF